jgi:hypothetical protein
VRIPRVRAALLRNRMVGTGGEHRGFGAYRRAGMRARGRVGRHRPLPDRTAGRSLLPGYSAPADSWRRLKAPAAVRGLSRGFGFRRPARRGAVCAWPLKARVAVASLASPARQFRTCAKTLNGPAASRAMSRRISTQGWACPSFPARVSATGIQWPGAVRIGMRRPCHGPHAGCPRVGPLLERLGTCRLSRSAALPGRARAGHGHALRGGPAARAGPRQWRGPHVALAPFAPQNSPFGYKEYQ